MTLTGYRQVVIAATGCSYCGATPIEPCRDMSMTYSQAGMAGWPDAEHVDYVHDNRSFAYHSMLGVTLPE